MSITLNVIRPKNQPEDWPKSTMFGLYDGHGGAECAEFLRDNLHHFVSARVIIFAYRFWTRRSSPRTLRPL